MSNSNWAPVVWLEMIVLTSEAGRSKGGVPLAGRKSLAQRFSAGWTIVCKPSAVGTAEEDQVKRILCRPYGTQAFFYSSPSAEALG